MELGPQEGRFQIDERLLARIAGPVLDRALGQCFERSEARAQTCGQIDFRETRI